MIRRLVDGKGIAIFYISLTYLSMLYRTWIISAKVNLLNDIQMIDSVSPFDLATPNGTITIQQSRWLVKGKHYGIT